MRPRVAVNVDSFGHSRGLVQLLVKAGYTGYLFCRPDVQHLSLPTDDFVWTGYDGSTVLAHRASAHYNSELGRARAKAERWLDAHADDQDGLLLWGVGNHGGGPSREDLRALASLARDTGDRLIVHGRPEDYVDALEARRAELPRVERDLNPWAPGCYTSMSTVKRAHRRLEAGLFAAEKMLAAAAVQGLFRYPHADLDSAIEALLFTEFHDTLGGIVRPGRRSAGAPAPRPRARPRRSASRPRVLRVALRRTPRRGRRVSRVRLQSPSVRGRAHGGLRDAAAGAEHRPGSVSHAGPRRARRSARADAARERELQHPDGSAEADRVPHDARTLVHEPVLVQAAARAAPPSSRAQANRRPLPPSRRGLRRRCRRQHRSARRLPRGRRAVLRPGGVPAARHARLGRSVGHEGDGVPRLPAASSR